MWANDPDEVSAHVDELLSKIADLKCLGVESVLQGEIVVRLAGKTATGSDLAAQIFGRQGGEASRAEYMKVVRALQTLQHNGYIARALFGKEKPYHLTRYGEERIMAAVGGKPPAALIPRGDLLLYAMAGSSATVSVVLTQMRANPVPLVACWLTTGIVSGLCVSRFLQTVRRLS